MKVLQLFVILLVGTGATLAASNRRPFRSLHAPKGTIVQLLLNNLLVPLSALQS